MKIAIHKSLRAFPKQDFSLKKKGPGHMNYFFYIEFLLLNPIGL